MAQAHTFPVTLGFKGIAMPWYGPGGSIAPFHHGVDYGCPVGSQVALSGKQIGLSGRTGKVSGPHLHVDRRPIGTSIVNRYNFLNPGRWWEITGRVSFVGAQGDAGNVIAVHSGGDEYRFLHLSEFSVAVGDIIAKEKPVSYIEPNTVRSLFADAEIPAPTDAQVSYYSTHPSGYIELYKDFWMYKRDEVRQLKQGLKYVPYTGKPLFVENK